MDLTNRNQFLNFSGFVLGGLALASLILGWVFDVDPTLTLSWDWRAIGWGLAGTLPLLLLFFGVCRLPIAALRKIRDFLSVELAPSLATLRWFDLILLAALTGVAEELFFRGWLEPLMARWGGELGREVLSAPIEKPEELWIGRWVASIIFGAAHWVTPTYAILATLVGVYLSWLMTLTEPTNLLTAIVTHAVYDYIGFLVIIEISRRAIRAESETPHDDDSQEST